jgi:hypothetical protein
MNLNLSSRNFITVKHLARLPHLRAGPVAAMRNLC